MKGSEQRIESDQPKLGGRGSSHTRLGLQSAGWLASASLGLAFWGCSVSEELEDGADSVVMAQGVSEQHSERCAEHSGFHTNRAAGKNGKYF